MQDPGSRISDAGSEPRNPHAESGMLDSGSRWEGQAALCVDDPLCCTIRGGRIAQNRGWSTQRTPGQRRGARHPAVWTTRCFVRFQAARLALPSWIVCSADGAYNPAKVGPNSWTKVLWQDCRPQQPKVLLSSCWGLQSCQSRPQQLDKSTLAGL